MLIINIPERELFDELTNTFFYTKPVSITLEHSLVAVSLWESKWKVPFLTPEEKTTEQLIDYIKCMTLTPDVPDETYLALTPENFKTIDEYISDSRTATFFSNRNGVSKSTYKKPITSDVVYFWMFSFQIPKECETWHLNRLITLIRVFEEENKPPKKQSKNAFLNQHRALNAARRKKYRKR